MATASSAWLSDLTGKAPLFKQKSLTCTHSEKSVAQPAGPSGHRAEKRLDVVVVKVLGLFHNVFHNLYTVQLLSAALCCRRFTQQIVFREMLQGPVCNI